MIPLLEISLWVLVTSAAAADGDALAVTRSGEPFRGALTGIELDGTLTFEAAGASRSLPAADLVYWGALPGTSQGAQFLLGPASMLDGKLAEVGDEDLTVESAVWPRVQLPRRSLRGVVFQPPIDPLQRDRLIATVLSSEGLQDRLWLANGDQLAGRLIAPPSRDETPEWFGVGVLHFVLPGNQEPLAVDLESVIALALAGPAGADRRPGSRGAHVGLRDGSYLSIRDLGEQDGQVRLTLANGTSLSVERPTFFTQLVYFLPYATDVAYLSDIDPLDYQHVPFVDLRGPYGRDRNVRGGRLRVNGRVYLKGLGVTSTSVLVYRLDDAWSSFDAELAIDDAARRGGSVNFRVLRKTHDGEEWVPAFESPLIRGGQPPIPISVDLRGTSRIALIVDFAERGDVLDYANWLNARLTK